ncbi:hypothetical protein VNI00_013150 [Paramarasmius palmivorus]|uniref:Uncharacterized protein n=1 Tax=Paramarasmius palmivorus TaxID=297713 RepID=A0AAW0C2L5_9AGAR
MKTANRRPRLKDVHIKVSTVPSCLVSDFIILPSKKKRPTVCEASKAIIKTKKRLQNAEEKSMRHTLSNSMTYSFAQLWFRRILDSKRAARKLKKGSNLTQKLTSSSSSIVSRPKQPEKHGQEGKILEEKGSVTSVQQKWEDRCKKVESKLKKMKISSHSNQQYYDSIFNDCIKPGHDDDSVRRMLDTKHTEVEKLKGTIFSYKMRALELFGIGIMVDRLAELEAQEISQGQSLRALKLNR